MVLPRNKNKIMKKYIKPQTDVAVIDIENVLTTGSVEVGEPGIRPEDALAPKAGKKITYDFD